MRGFKAVLFDCDGVLADSEHLVDRVLAEDLTARGWVLTPEESGAVFLGMALPDMAPVVKAKLGHLPPDWTEQLKRKVTETMAREVPPVPGAEALLQRLRRSPLPLALASNSSRLELSAKLGRLGFAPFFGDRIFSFEDVARPKPHPDIYLAAAAACRDNGEHDAAVRRDALAGMGELGIVLDEDRNATGSGARRISSDESRVAVLVVPTNEELAIARDCVSLL